MLDLYILLFDKLLNLLVTRGFFLPDASRASYQQEETVRVQVRRVRVSAQLAMKQRAILLSCKLSYFHTQTTKLLIYLVTFSGANPPIFTCF